MTKERLDELVNYYTVSSTFLEEVIKNIPKTASKDDVQKATSTLNLFRDTLSVLNDYSDKFANDIP